MHFNFPLSREKLSNILDIGCGKNTIAKEFNYSKLYLIDINIKSLKNNQLKTKDGTLCINGDIFNLPISSSSIDLILCKQVLHHLKEPQLINSELYRILKSHAYFYLIDIIVDIEDAFFNCASYIRNKNHIRYYSLREIFDIFSEHFKLVYYFLDRHRVTFDKWLKNCNAQQKKEVESTFATFPREIKDTMNLTMEHGKLISFMRKEGHFLFEKV
jgi:ubiquinone/menaquinone biosynthesis C-methylase UbiE